jgi:hypothetical protein
MAHLARTSQLHHSALGKGPTIFIESLCQLARIRTICSHVRECIPGFEKECACGDVDLRDRRRLRILDAIGGPGVAAM